ncbi:alpha-glucosidase [Rhodoferax ferrireducens]|uniref:Alpha-glucosidase n=1 Tax=Rhodoferax ferrireducens TaxID=192843 RepID=A0ABU2CAQ2_9BURK|nr:glycoside hydrolase family 31 protein [Rhodoferax ferrireducens]MDR7378419.1 alpha-glucosidase [Rhodoferax ferrireducens]
MRLDHPPLFALHARSGNQLELRSSGGAVAHIWVLEEDILRVLVLPNGQLQMPRSWTVAPGLENLPVEGRDRFDTSGFSLPNFTLEQDAQQLCITTTAVRLTIQLEGFFCRWESQHKGQWQATAADRSTQSYNFGWWDEKIYHYLQRERGEAYFGLGERAGDANRAGQRYRMCNLDPMGYSARNTDPLYKHIPFYITRKGGEKDAGLCFGLFYDTLSDCSFDMGRELDNYHGHYRYFVADHGDLDLYYIAGADPAAITRRYTWLTGRPIFPPRYALGYSGSTMSYTDAPNAQERMGEFLERCEEHDIPCDSFHLSSGYTSIGPGRYVFNWNREKFPDPAAFVQSYLAKGVRLVPNIKPALLRDHPRFDEARKAGLLVQDPDGQPTAIQFWDGTGAYLDFTNPATIAWWKQQVTEQLLQYGIPTTWNDNNEYEIWSDQAMVHGFGTPRRAREAKPQQTLLMMQASHAAQTEFAPQERPYLVSRSGAAGMQRYVQTWSGDNYTDWETLRYNIRMGLGLAMSGVSNTGHDIGGFSGPAPGPELLVRWVQHGIFLPRFSIHSWNDDQTVNEPWMYPAVTPQIRELIALRYRLMPYLYDLVWRYHSAFEPIIRPTYHDFPEDPRCLEENDEMLLGAHLLVASVVEQGQSQRAVWLPGSGGWYEWHTARHHQAGQQVTLDAPLAGPPPLLAREGCAIPMNFGEIHFGQVEDQRGFQVFPFLGEGVFEATCFEDDGHSQACRDGNFGQWRLQLRCTAQSLEIGVQREGMRPPQQGSLVLLLPAAERRNLSFSGATLTEDVPGAHWRRLTLKL